MISSACGKPAVSKVSSGQGKKNPYVNNSCIEVIKHTKWKKNISTVRLRRIMRCIKMPETK